MNVALHSTEHLSSIDPTGGQSEVMPHGNLPWEQISWFHHIGSFHVWHLGSLPACSMAAPPSWNFKIQKFQTPNTHRIFAASK